MKRILLFILALIPACGWSQLITLGPFYVYQSVASNVPITKTIRLDVRGQQNVAVEWTVNHSGTATAVEGCQVRPSIDGSNVVGEIQGITITPASIPTVTLCTNLLTYGYPYMIVQYMTNNDADTYQTNLFKYYLKRDAP